MIWRELQVIQKDTSRMHLVGTERGGGEHKEVNTIRCRTSPSSSQQSDTITKHKHKQTQTATNTRTRTKHDLLVVQRDTNQDAQNLIQKSPCRCVSAGSGPPERPTLGRQHWSRPPARGAAPARSSSTSCMISLADESIAGTSPQRAVRLGARVGRLIRRIS